MSVRCFLARYETSLLEGEIDGENPVVLTVSEGCIQVGTEEKDEATIFQVACDMADMMASTIDTMNRSGNLVSSTSVKELEFLGEVATAQ